MWNNLIYGHLDGMKILLYKNMMLFLFLSWASVSGTETDETESVSVMEGDSVTLQSNVNEILNDDTILWLFGPGDSLISQIGRKNDFTSVFVTEDEGFRGRLQVDQKSGSLTIRNSRMRHSGRYKIAITREKTTYKIFIVNVSARLPVPIISRDCSSSSSSSCSVVNVSHVTLSWYKGNSLLSSISVSDLSSSVSLHLEVDYQDNNSYSCVINNHICNQTTHLDTGELCQIHSDSECVCCCDTTKAVIQLVISALVGVATVVVLGFEITSGKAEKKKHPHTKTTHTSTSALH